MDASSGHARADSGSADGPLYLYEGEDWTVPAPLPRVLAWLLDAFASVIITLSLHRFLGTALLNMFGIDSIPGMILANSFWFIGGFGYWVVMPAWTGATPAKILFNLRVVSIRPEPLTPMQVILREVLGHAAMIATAGVGFVLAVRDPLGRGPNDRAADTRLIQFTSSRTELYLIQDLQLTGERDTLVSYAVNRVSGPDDDTGESDAPDAAAGAATDTGAAAVEDPAGSADDTAGMTGGKAPAFAPSKPLSRPTTSVYAREKAETAFERRQKAARGPTVEEISEALRRTAALVAEGQLMPKVLARKRLDFIEQLARVQLGDDPKTAVQTIIALGREGILEREQLEQARDILKARLSGPQKE